MNISYNWLKRYVDTDLGAEEVARILTDIGLEVEGFEKIETIKGGLAGVVVGEVLTAEQWLDRYPGGRLASGAAKVPGGSSPEGGTIRYLVAI